MTNSYHLGIDATNIQSGGGGLTHLSQMLDCYAAEKYEINKITIWTSKYASDKLPDRQWIFKKTNSWIEKNIFFRFLWQQFIFPRVLKNEKCDILFSPGGTIPFKRSIPVVCMSQNMLPFETNEAKFFGLYSLMYLKMVLLKYIQGWSFKNSDGVIFLTEYAYKSISEFLHFSFDKVSIIPHGIEPRFLAKPRFQMHLNMFTSENPFKFLYVSILMPYKHQCEIAHAAKQLQDLGFNIEIRFIGSSWSWYGKKFRALINSLDPKHKFLIWNGDESFESLHHFYKDSDAFIFGSSCENLPNILLEAMASGLPIASSNYGPMPEVLSDSGIYFDPLNIDSILNSLVIIMRDTDLRKSLSSKSWEKSKQYTWEKCADQTFKFMHSIVSKVS